MDGDAASPLTAHTVLHVGLTQLPESRVEPTALVLVEAGCGVPQVWHEQLVDGADRGHGSIKGCLYERKFTERAHGYDKKLKLKMSKQGIYKWLENRAVDPLSFFADPNPDPAVFLYPDPAQLLFDQDPDRA